MRMLVFDDDAAVGRLVTRVATLAGLEAAAVTEPDAFRQSLADLPPQVILLDLQLGVTDGVEQLRFLAEQRYGGAIIVMSGFDARVLAATATVASGDFANSQRENSPRNDVVGATWYVDLSVWPPSR